ncbi:MAG: methionine--tRNA ligase [Candidatus Roizmanbacteria bacterium]|nr:methionine--tRNA ligase [Candidatus Roizmanbacteria bacterium]
MDTISFEEFQKLNIRTGTIKSVTIPEGSEKLYRLEVDCGEEFGTRIVFAGIKNFYTPEELEGKQIVVLMNLEPKRFFNEESGGMLLAADEDSRPVFLQPEKPVKNGTKVR